MINRSGSGEFVKVVEEIRKINDKVTIELLNSRYAGEQGITRFNF
jgi:lipoate synthase